MKYITIDSNIVELPLMAAQNVTPKSKVWCRAINKCQKPSENTNHKKTTTDLYSVYYNTPISMADNVIDYKFDENTTHFIYIDFDALNPTLSRIMKNLKYINGKCIVISKMDSAIPPIGLYHLKAGKCSKQSIAELIANIIILYQIKEKPVHPEDIQKVLALSQDAESKNLNFGASQVYEIVNNSKCNVSKSMIIDLYNMLQNNNQNEKDDCQICDI